MERAKLGLANSRGVLQYGLKDHYAEKRWGELDHDNLPPPIFAFDNLYRCDVRDLNYRKGGSLSVAACASNRVLCCRWRQRY